MKHVLLLGSLAVLLFACSASKDSSTSMESSFSGETVTDAAVFRGASDAFEVLGEPTVAGNTLELVVQYSGGCETHNWTLASSGMMKKSLPPQLGVSVVHAANEDHCKKLIQDTLRFDLSSLAQPNGQKIILNLRAGDRDFDLPYVFDSNR